MNQQQIDDAVADAEIMISTCEKMTGLVEGHHTYDTAWLLRICRALVSSRTTRPEAAQKMWLVEFDGQPQAAYPRMVQAEVYASGFSRAAKIIEGTFVRSPRLGCEHVWHAGDQGCRKCGAPQP